MRKWEDALKDHMNKVLEAGFPKEKLLGIFLYGSQNYKIDTENSDIDTKAIIVPSLSGLCFEKPVSKELHLDNGEHCEVKDIRCIVDMFKKQNINFLEILYTDYYWVNPKYAQYWKLFTDNAEAIVHYDEDKAVKSIAGQALHTLKQITENDLIKGKKYANALRMKYFFEHYIMKRLPYKECIELKNDQRDIILAYKTGKIVPSAKEIEDLIELFSFYMTYENSLKRNPKTEEMLKQFSLILITNNNPTYQFYEED